MIQEFGHIRHRTRSLLVTIVACVLVILFHALGDAADSPARVPMQKVTIAYSSISGNMAPLWIAYEAGLFRKYGLDVQLVFIEGGSKAAESLVSGEVALAQMAGAGVIQSNLEGSDAVMVAGVVNTLTFQFIVDKNIKRPEMLKGTAVGVTGYGSSTDFVTRYTLEKYRLQPEKDVGIVPLGTMPALFAGLEAGTIQGAMLSAPFTLKAKKAGFAVLADLQLLGLEYQHTGLATTKRFINSQRGVVLNALKAYVEGIHYYKTHRQESLAVLQKYLKTDDVQAVTEIYEDIGLTLTPEKPYPTVMGIRTILQELAGKEPEAGRARPEDFADLSFVKELDSSGFIDRLYRSSTVSVSRQEVRPGPGSAAVKAETAPHTRRTKPDVPLAKPSSTPGPRNGFDEYIVKAGDTLSQLAALYYRDGLKWMKIYKANSVTMDNPNFIYVGQKIVIPVDDQARM